MPRPTAAGVLVALLTTVLLGGCAEPGGIEVSGPAPTPMATGELPVRISEGPGRPLLSRPATFEIGGTVRLSGLRWASWGGPVAEATGEVSGTWCAPGCRREPVRVRVRLAGLLGHGDRAYYSRASVTADGLPARQRSELSDLRLFVPKR
ncbi:hypothetical protein I5Q34_13945 [Streptomyces sp. AV19]|uniref:hypothetical protein n=1 Tax=Streptomyces sp. AV19 TaxID=2793068 RepID=UPI0018FE257D|nr:hypothetical protein [Streptomyces sp. AV19]MBH1935361.1 hypothetical protein [Streptomyces sp. AV19]MDG4531247.1 hypothetical protein [Streptomyces sp. AV19]